MDKKSKKSSNRLDYGVLKAGVLKDGVLKKYGWASFHARVWKQYLEARSTLVEGPIPARVIFASRDHYRVMTQDGERLARPAGALRQAADEGSADQGSTDQVLAEGLPVVGDWVAIDAFKDGESMIRAVLARRTSLSRKVAGARTVEQKVAANVDTIFLVMGLDGDYNLRRLERFVVMATSSGAQPVVVLTKADMCADPLERRLEAEDVSAGAPVHVTSALIDEGLEPLRFYLQPGSTTTLIGSSGAGKSTLINRLCGSEVMRTGAVREGDDRGRHTTTHRQLVELPEGGLLIDNPGVREIQLWSDGDDLDSAFNDIEELAAGCRFSDCGHVDEPGCAVLEAIDEGRLDVARLDSLRRLQRELEHLERRQDVAAQRRRGRKFGAMYKAAIAQKKSRR